MDFELIKKFPATPKNKIVYVVYDQRMVGMSEDLIRGIWGDDYLENNVVVVSYDQPIDQTLRNANNDVYIDPLVYKYKHSWFD